MYWDSKKFQFKLLNKFIVFKNNMKLEKINIGIEIMMGITKKLVAQFQMHEADVSKKG